MLEIFDQTNYKFNSFDFCYAAIMADQKKDRAFKNSDKKELLFTKYIKLISDIKANGGRYMLTGVLKYAAPRLREMVDNIMNN